MSQEERLLVVTESLGIGGTESHLIKLLPELAKRGWTVATFCLTERGARAGSLDAAGVEVFSPEPGAKLNGRGLRHPIHLGRSAGSLFRLMRHWRPDIAHFYLPGPYLIGAPLAIAARVPIKVMSRRSLSYYQRRWPVAGRIERLLHRHMDAVAGNSRAVVDELIAEGIPDSKVRLIYNGIEAAEPLPDRQEVRDWLGLDDDTLVGIMVANLIPYKGHRDLIEGLAAIASDLPPRWCVLLPGHDRAASAGNLRAELEALAEARGIGSHLRFLGERSDVPRLLAAADFGLLTSHHEGFANVILEGMAAGLPMIVTAVGGNPEAVLDGKTGFVVPPGEAKAIGAAVLRLARDPDLRHQLGDAGQERVTQEFSMERCVTAHAELYADLLAKSRARSASR